MKYLNIFLILLSLPFLIKAQTLTNSNLPIVIITTDNLAEIPDEPKVFANMKIIHRLDNTRNYLTDQNTAAFLNYNGRIKIEIRGSISQTLPKKAYGLSTLKSDNISNNNVSILGMSKENDWILNALGYEPSLMRDYLSYELSRNMGNYASRGMYCEVIVNGDYKGLYLFMEKLKIDDNRINIVKMTTADNKGSNVTGGYVTKCDKTTGGDPIAWKMSRTASGSFVDFLHDSPSPEEITTQQNNYIYNQFLTLENVMTEQNSSITNGYPSVIDVPSFVDFMIMNEFASNADSYQISTYFHKDRKGKLRAGPIWDFNLTYGNYDRSHTDVWQFNDGDNTGAKFWNDLFNNSTFNCYLTKRWIELTAANQPLNYNVISNRIDQLVSFLAEAEVRERTRWSTTDIFADQINALRTWIQLRTIWLNTKLNNCQACSNISLPALVISKINYNPAASGAYVSDSLEYIEITNNSTQTINLTGYYFRELGITYQFPPNSTIAANAKIMLASNSGIFQRIYGFIPFGQFIRCMSNKSQKLVLADAFGNIIDQVEYTDSLPWPADADGSDSFLELTDLNSDNSLASNWKASGQLSDVKNNSFVNTIKIIPIPAQSSISIIGNSRSIKSIEITDLTGRSTIGDYNFIPITNSINIENLLSGIYLLKINFDEGTSIIKKIIKN